MLIISQIQEIRNNLSRLLGKVKVTDGTNDMPAMDAAARRGYVTMTDGTNTQPTLDAAARAGYVKVTDGTNSLPTMDAATRAGYVKVTDGSYTQPAMDAAARRGYVTVTDGTNTQPTLDAAARAGYVKVTDGTNSLPAMDAAGRAGFQKITDGTTTLAVQLSGSNSINSCIAIGGSDESGNFQSERFQTGSTDGKTGATVGPVINARKYGYNGASWDRERIPTLYFDVQAASGSNILASAGSGKKSYIHQLVITVDTAGLVTISDGIGRFYMPANGCISMNFPNGKGQSTTATAIAMTNSGGGNVTACGTYRTE